MPLWHYLFATILSLIWYMSESGQFSIQAGIWLLCFLLIFPADCTRNESSTQTDGGAEESSSQTSETGYGRDETDTAIIEQTTPIESQYPNVQKSLHQVFRCAYAQLVLPWYNVPEPGDSQPLFEALLREFNLIVDQIIYKAKDFDLSFTSVGCIEIFTQHLHYAKKPDWRPLFISQAEEMVFLRDFTESLMRNLFPQHLWESKVYHCALREILAIKVLALVTLLSDPDNLNRLLLSQLDRMPSENSVGEGHDTDKEETSSSFGAENTEVPKDEAGEHLSEEIKSKKKGRKVMEKVSNFFKHKKKISKKEKDQMQRALCLRRPAVIETDCASNCEDSVTDSDDSDAKSYSSSLPENLMEFKLSFEMWRAGTWQVTVTKVVTEDETLCFTLHLDEKNNPENLHWDVQKTQSEIVDFYNHYKDTPCLPSISTIVENTETRLEDKDYQEEAKTVFEHFLQVLVEDAKLGHMEHVFRFLCPLHRLLGEEDGDGGVWDLLGGLASFLSPGQEDDEASIIYGPTYATVALNHRSQNYPNNLRVEEKPDELVLRGNISEVTPQCDEPAPARPEDTHTLPSQYSEMEGELLVTDSGYSPSSDRTNDFKSGKQHTEPYDYPSREHNQVMLGRSESVSENLALFAARTKVIPKKQPALFNSFDSDGESQEHYETDSFSDFHLNETINKKEHLFRKKSTDKPEGKEKTHHIKEGTQSLPQVQKKTTNAPSWGQPEVNKVIFDLLKEISGNSRLLKFIKTFLTPFMALVKKKMNAFLKKLNPSEAQIADYVDQLRELIWPEGPVSQDPPRSSEDKNKTMEKAMHLLSSKLAGYLIFSKTDVEITFKILQDTEKNKMLVYVLLSRLLNRFLPGEFHFDGLSKLNRKNSA
ncbi:hypothetical protein NFI96_014327 [Prochilodus magdalenae]|nr:hypothetical protein NFI96_014327 [Prochilodus magdalenae]